MAKVQASSPFQLEDVGGSTPSTPQTGLWNIRQEPMKIYLSNLLDASEINGAIGAGWTEGVSGFPTSQAEVETFLNECNTLDITCRLSFGGSFGSNADIDWLLSHANFDRLDGFEFEGGQTDSQMQYALDQVTAIGREDMIYSYAEQYLNGATQVVTSHITGVSIGGGGDLTVTALGHGLSNGTKIGIYAVMGMTELNYRTFEVANRTTDTFRLDEVGGGAVDGSGYSAWTSGGRIWHTGFPTMACWKNRSRLWYPFSEDQRPIPYNWDESQTYDANGIASHEVSNITQATNAAVTTTLAHGYVTGQQVILKGVAGMTEINDIPTTITVTGANTFTCDDINSSAFTAYSSDGDVKSARTGRTKQVSVFYDMPFEPAYNQGLFFADDPDNRKTHHWLQCFGQPMELADYRTDYPSGVQPGAGHMFTQLMIAHWCGSDSVTWFVQRFGMFDNTWRDSPSSVSGSPAINYLWEADRHSATSLTTQEVGAFERTWTRLLDAVAKYKAGPGYITRNVDNAFGYENPKIGVVPNGQSPTRR